ncbi:DNA sulfur modification protein DndD [Candidatus Parabeggiatoa sp. HSG14]|uniref:DNA sulfur modification protein DndD n=1 Tax=Candidatus Parabeggiatoa sp. HSG14 TaxID=3055593 RepID=UPI0025A7485F|nr:DNA sulfur modification protein DndD [Thiotrichales bacterium HSG14]
MVFEEIVLDNFGIYKGHHVIKLTPPSAKKAVILLGGLNGSGKTTLLDALQLTLYGKFAKYSNRGNINYFDYLRQMINYHVEPTNGAALELQFKHFRDGKEESLRIHRSWYVNGKSIKETVEVERDGILDPVITERWYEYVEEFIPARISSLFFFDGEKIEALADTDKAAALLRTGIYALLGLDLVDRLSTDLSTVERKRKTLLQTQQSRLNISTLEEEVERLEGQVKEIAQQKIKMQRHFTQSKKTLGKLREEYRREGGELFEQREVIEAELKETQQNLFQTEEQLREIASGEAPLLMIRDLLRDAEKQAIQEKEAKHYQELHEELENHDGAILKLLKKHAVNRTALTAVERFVKKDKVKRQQSIETECYLNVAPKIFIQLQDSFLNQLQASANTFIEQIEEITEEIHGCERQLASIPDPESLKGIKDQLQNIQKEIEQAKLKTETLEFEHHRVSNKVNRLQAELTQAYEMEAQEEFVSEVTSRVIKHSEKVRNTLEKFGFAVTKKHIRQLESLILDSFQQLIRKNDFITQVEIDPNNYTLTLYTPNHEKLPPESLSAGERQLLAISVLWGLSRASGRPLPAIIDTPLSRLDGKHRDNLIDNYFHQASHQVILLSTDEEINKKYYRNLKHAIGREYHLSYEEKNQSAIINQGYFF